MVLEGTPPCGTAAGHHLLGGGRALAPYYLVCEYVMLSHGFDSEVRPWRFWQRYMST